MTSTAMPSLSSNRLAFQRVSAPIGAPAPEIGNVLYVASDVDSDGYSTDPEFGPMVTWRRVSLCAVIAIVAFGISWLMAMPMVGGQSPALAALLATAPTAFFVWIAWRGMGTTKRYGSCVYVGTEGVTQIRVDGAKRDTKTTLFRDELVTTTTHTSVVINGAYAYTLEQIAFFEPDGSFVQSVVGTYNQQPSALALAARATTAAAGAKRAANAQAKLARGEQIVFPLFAEENDPKSSRGEALVLDASSLSYFKARGAQPLRVDRANARLVLRQGYLDLSAGGGMVLGTFERTKVGNYDLLSALVGTTR